MADDGRDAGAAADQQHGLERLERPCEAAVGPVEIDAERVVGVAARDVIHLAGEALLRLEDEDEVVVLALDLGRRRGDGERVVVEESDAGDPDEDVLARAPAQGGRHGDPDAVVAQAGEVRHLAADGADGVGLEEEAVDETADPDGEGGEEVVPAGEHVVAVPEHHAEEAHAGEDVEMDEELVAQFPGRAGVSHWPSKTKQNKRKKEEKKLTGDGEGGERT